MNFSNIWTPEALFIADMFRDASYEVRVVGGAVRDCLVGAVPTDIDLATNATPTEMLEIAAAQGIRTVDSGIKHGTVSLIIDGTMIEVTTLRRDVETDGRHAKVDFIRDFKVDAARRDFTINAMSVDGNFRLHDSFGGRDDLATGIVRFVGDPNARIREDYLRILRYFRFRGRFGHGTITTNDQENLSAVAANKNGLGQISGERIWQEMSRLLTDTGGFGQLPAMEQSGVLKAIGMPQLLDTRNANRAAWSGADAPVILGFLLAETNVTLAALRERWRFGNEDFFLAKAAIKLSGMHDASFDDFLAMAMLPGARRDRIASVLVGFGRHDDAARIIGPLVEFPVQGRDVLAAGFKPGPGIGKAISTMRTAWTISGYVATKEELLANLVGLPMNPSF